LKNGPNEEHSFQLHISGVKVKMKLNVTMNASGIVLMHCPAFKWIINYV